MSSLLGEAMAARYGINLAISFGYNNVILENDNQELINNLMSDSRPHSPVGVIAGDIRMLAL